MWKSSTVSWASTCSQAYSASMRLPSCGVPLPSLESTTSSPMSTPVKRADDA